MRPGTPERHQRYPKSAKFSGHYVPWAGALGGPRLPKAHSRRHRTHFTKALPKAFYREKPWAALGGPRQLQEKALCGLGEQFF